MARYRTPKEIVERRRKGKVRFERDSRLKLFGWTILYILIGIALVFTVLGYAEYGEMFEVRYVLHRLELYGTTALLGAAPVARYWKRRKDWRFLALVTSFCVVHHWALQWVLRHYGLLDPRELLGMLIIEAVALFYLVTHPVAWWRDPRWATPVSPEGTHENSPAGTAG